MGNIVSNQFMRIGNRRIEVSFVNPPIPTRDQDWCAVFPDSYDYDSIIGRGATAQEAVDDLMEQHLDSVHG